MLFNHPASIGIERIVDIIPAFFAAFDSNCQAVAIFFDLLYAQEKISLVREIVGVRVLLGLFFPTLCLKYQQLC